ncbi:MAG: ribokinase [Fimbriimonas sp.]
MPQHDVLVIGSANMDLVVHAPRFPAPGETLLGGPFSTHPGGKGANQAVAAAKLGAKVAFCGCLGEDGFGDELFLSLTSAGVDPRWLRRDSSVSSGVALIQVDDTGQNTIVVAPGANFSVKPDDVAEAISQCDAPVILLQLEIPLESVAAAVKAAKGRTVILNPAPAQALPPEILQGITWLTPNETEAREISHMAVFDPATAARAGQMLLGQGVRGAIITLGAQGSMLIEGRASRHFPAVEVDAVDTTASGDAFHGALATFLAQGLEIEDAITRANKAGAICATRVGAQSAMPTLADLELV